MAQTISQSLTVPSNVTAGGTIQAADVTTLYNTFNSFSIPDTIAALLQSAYSTDSAQNFNGPATSTGSVLDVPITVPAARVLISIGSFQWGAATSHASTGAIGLGGLAFRANASTSVGSTGGYIVTPSLSTSTSGNGLFVVISAPHDASYARPAISLVAMSTGNTFITASTADMPAVAWTNWGVGLGTGTSTANQIDIGYIRVWRQR